MPQMDRSGEQCLECCYTSMVITFLSPLWLPAVVIIGVVGSPYFLYKGVRNLRVKPTNQ